jgi:hypothetical protein
MHCEIPARILDELGGDAFMFIWEILSAHGEQREEGIGVSDGFEYVARLGLIFYKDNPGGRDYLNILVSKNDEYRLEFLSQEMSVKKDVFIRTNNLGEVSDLIRKYIFDKED